MSPVAIKDKPESAQWRASARLMSLPSSFYHNEIFDPVLCVRVSVCPVQLAGMY